MKFRKIILSKYIKNLYSLNNWFKRVLLHDNVAILNYKENQLDKKFNQYYKFIDVLKNYDILSFNEAHESKFDVNRKQIEEHKKLIKNVNLERSQEKYK